jgi:thioesterase domain-containing protein/aryl carrier-like protein
VVVRNDASGEKQLAAYVAMAPGQAAPSVEALRAHLRKTMPDFMLPAVFSVQPSLPLTTSGKVDRRALPDLAAGAAPTAGDFVAPGTELERKVAAIWSQTLGVPRVGLGDDFFALGGHSLAALKLITRLRDAGYELEVAELFQHSSLGGMIGALKPVASESVTMTSGEYVVRVKEGRPGVMPLCLLPSDFGDLLIYANLIPLLSPEQPCIGLQCPHMYENDEGITSMPALAAFFIRHLQAVQPQGPYMLAGYCFGGFVALEMAKQLRAAGHTVAMLGLIDARPYRPRVERSEYLMMLLQGAFHARPSDWWRYLSARWAMRRETKLIDSMARLHPDQLGRRELNRWVLETRVMHNYRSEGYAGPVTFFYPEESQYQLYGDPSCGWLYQAERVFLHKVPGSHLNMMKDPHVRLLAEKLAFCIQQATGKAP